MNRERPDRRVTRTRRALREALIGLILEKGGSGCFGVNRTNRP